MRGNLKDPIEKFLRRFTIDPVPDILGGEVILTQDILRQQKSVVPEGIGNPSNILANADLDKILATACPR